jgi:hypothetical protein
VTLVAGQAAPVVAARTHVLIIGVGNYPNATPANPASYYCTLLGMNLSKERLTSPPKSARAVADWFIKDFNNARAPLGSVELLLAEAEPQPYCNPHTGVQYDPIEPATFARIQKAFQRWEARCNMNTGNVAVFYFCGHGAEVANRILLPADFPVPIKASGEPNWNRVVNFSSTRVNMEFCKAAHQFYFLDCCRLRPDQLARLGLGVPLISARVLQASPPVRAQPVYTIPDRDTTGANPGQISAFTDLLLNSLRGAAAELEKGIWHVTAMRLLTACEKLAEVFPEEGLQGTAYPIVELDRSVPFRDNPVLHQYPQGAPPRVPARIRLRPQAAAQLANYAAQQGTRTIPLQRHRTWHYGHGFLPPGGHTIQVAFPVGAGWKCDPQTVSADPPVCVCDCEAS